MILIINNSCGRETLELVGKALELSKRFGDTAVLVIGWKLDCESVLDYGVDRLMVVEDERLERLNFEPTLRISKKIVEDLDPDIVLSPATTFGRTLMPALSATFRTGLTADCTDLFVDDDGEFVQVRPAIGGNVMAHIVIPDRKPKMATVRPGSFDLPKKRGRKENAKIEKLEFPDEYFESSIELLKFEKRVGVDLKKADVIVTVGKGLRKKENVKLAQKLAELVNGAVGATRAVVDAKWLSHDHQIGLSGKTVSPEVYLAFGVSGAVQHVAGMQSSKIVIAVNKDRYAPIFKVSDIGIVADAKMTLEEIIRRLES